MIISLIVAASDNLAIGKNNQLLWHLPNDMKWFKSKTWGLPVIMGRKTFESMNGEILKGRKNIVITRNADWQPNHAEVLVAADLQASIALANESTKANEIMIVGGGEIYKLALPLANRIYFTHVHTQIDGDAFFPAIDKNVWQQTFTQEFDADEKHAFAYTFEIWERKANEQI